MSSRNSEVLKIIFTLIVVVILCVALVRQRDDASAPEAPALVLPSPVPTTQAPQTDDRDIHYEQLLRKRLEFEEKVFEAMNVYRVISQKVHAERAQLRKLLGDTPVSEAIELFRKGVFSEIPSHLHAAFSCWQTLLPDETQRLHVAMWIDRQQASGILEQLDNQIREIEHRRQWERISDQEELAEIDRLLAQQVTVLPETVTSDRALLEEEAIEKQKIELANWE